MVAAFAACGEKKAEPEAAPEAEVIEEVEEVEEPTIDIMSQATKPLASIEDMVQEWQAQQRENAQMIQAKLEEVEAEKAAQQEEEPEVEEVKESILPDDIRKLMEELEAESADIEAQKARVEEEPAVEEEEEIPFGEEESKPLFQKVVEQITTSLDMVGEKVAAVVPGVPVAPAAPVVPEVEAPAPELELADPEENEAFIEKESFEKAMAEALQDVRRHQTW